MSPRGRVYLTTFGKVAFARPIEAEFGQFRCLPLHPAVPEARFSCAADDFAPQARLVWRPAQTETARNPWLNGAPERQPRAGAARDERRARALPMRAARALCLDPPSLGSADLRLLLRLPDSALGRAVARSLRIGFAHIRALLGLAVAARA